jgi:hypothetical protein
MQPEFGMVLDKRFFDENQRSADFLVDQKLTPSRASANDFIYDQLMRDIDPGLVTF